MSFSFEELKKKVRRFAEQAPQLLLRHTETADLALLIDKLNLAEQLETRFTAAIIGPMRQGKSTLLNALIGQTLAPTGINETTATVNYFRHGSGELCRRFRVHWTDGSTEDRPLDDVKAWLGRENNPKRTRLLEFFADTELLKTATLVDTPGIRSTLETHENTTKDFLAERLEEESFKHGGRADAMVYMLNYGVRENDKEMLELFGERTRLPGASVNNSIAVVQKWETLEVPDPWQTAKEKCAQLRWGILQGKVVEVVPTSGLLGWLALTLDDEIWEILARLGTETDSRSLERLLLNEPRFCKEQPGIGVDVATREMLCRRIDWQVLPYILLLVQARKLSSGEELRQAVWEVSGIDRLRELLKSRFFTQAGLIKVNTILHKADRPCQTGLLRLRQLAEQRREDLLLGDRSEALLEPLISREPSLTAVLDYVRRTRGAVQNDQNLIERTRQQLDDLRASVLADFRMLDQDLQARERLTRLAPSGEIATEEHAELDRLFGGVSPGAWDRIGLPEETPVEQVEEYLWSRHEHWKRCEVRAAGDLKKVAAHAVACLDRLIDVVAEQRSG